LILSVFKPAGWTSFDVVHKLRKELRWKKAGHAGTLDPPAQGVLILLFGDATTRSTEFMDERKEYRARIRFGLETTTDDLAGEILKTYPIDDWSETRIRESLRQFCGELQQVPPYVSAIKVEGKRSYKRVRSGTQVDLAPRAVHVYSVELIQIQEPEIEVLISCSKGTYIRSIARDLGQVLGWGGALATLMRTAIGEHRVESALSLQDIILQSSVFCSSD
jgi:tRNA pseudouridine55 synthase